MTTTKSNEKEVQDISLNNKDAYNRELKETILSLNGKEVIIQTGKLATACNGSVTIKCGDTVLLVTVTGADEPRKDIDFFPLLCDFEERICAVGRIPGSYNRREGKFSDKAVLTCRLMDRPLRPLFPENYFKDVQVVATALSIDQINPPDTLAILGASFALSLSILISSLDSLSDKNKEQVA